MPSARKDPAPRPTDQLLPYNTVKNPKDGYHYVLVSQDGSEYSNPEYYEMLGWKPVIADGKPNSTRLMAGKWKEGQPIVSMGQLLMEMDPETWERIEKYGVNGNSGQAAVDKLAQQMRAAGGVDPVRSRRGIGAAQVTSNSLDADTSQFFGA